MSSIYVLEPPTKGKVVLSTSVGDIDIELWPKEAPKAVRNFVQLCLDGYYNGTVFHRIIKGFMAQGGDRSKAGTGGESIYGKPFADEFHTRLRFTHRGLVACANPGQPDSNNSQFFITLDRTEWLDKKNTIFGKVTGDTIYNALKLGECNTDSEDRPLEPPVIYSVEILWNPFDDMVPQKVYEEKKKEAEEPKVEKKPPVKEKKRLQLLSFGEEAEEEEEILKKTNIKIKSSHDVLEDRRLLKANEQENEQTESERNRRDALKDSVKKALKKDSGREDLNKKLEGREKEKGEGSPSTSGRSDSDGGERKEDFDSRMRQKVLDKRRKLEVPGKDKKTIAAKETRKDESTDESSGDESDDGDENGSEEEKRRKREKLEIKPTGGIGSEARVSQKEASMADSGLMSPLEQQRAKYKQRKRERGEREKQALEMMEMFRKKLREGKGGVQKPEEKEAPDEVKEEEDDSDWFKHRLKFSLDGNKRDDMSRNDDPNQYVLVDPLLEKGKEKFNKLQAKMKRRNREWAGRSLD